MPLNNHWIWGRLGSHQIITEGVAFTLACHVVIILYFYSMKRKKVSYDSRLKTSHQVNLETERQAADLQVNL
jgi:hypothetical protein